jgi:poly(3-hydroxybutyrate) depolymerase
MLPDFGECERNTIVKTSNINLGTMMVAFAALTHGENSDEVQNPFVGTWKLTSNWLKKGSEGIQVMMVNPDLTGTIEDVGNGWTTELRNVELNGNALSFDFYFEDTKDYEVDFEGTIVGKKIKGEFNIFGAKAAVAGMLLSAEEAAQIAAQPTIFDIYEARSYTGSKNNTLPYRLFIPENYDPIKKYPLVLFHHGGGGTGDNNRQNLEGECIREWILPEVQANNPCFIVAPQFPGKKSKSVIDGTFSMRGHIQTIHEVLDSLEKEFSIDKNREYVTGLSFGGECAWMSLVQRPDRFAAGIPICATDVYTDLTVAERKEHLAQLPLWIFHGDADDVVPVEVSRKIVKALRDSGGNPRYTEYPGVNHDSWSLAYRDPELVKWLFAQKRSSNSR